MSARICFQVLHARAHRYSSSAVANQVCCLALSTYPINTIATMLPSQPYDLKNIDASQQSAEYALFSDICAQTTIDHYYVRYLPNLLMIICSESNLRY